MLIFVNSGRKNTNFFETTKIFAKKNLREGHFFTPLAAHLHLFSINVPARENTRAYGRICRPCLGVKLALGRLTDVTKGRNFLPPFVKFC